MSLGEDPIMLIAAAGALAALVAIIFACRIRSGFLSAVLFVLALVFAAPAGYVVLALNPEWVDGRFRTYKGFYRDIEVGMTREQVHEAMALRYPTNGPRKRPKIHNDPPERMGFLMDPETSTEPNCEWIVLTLEGGRVTGKKYSAD